MLPQPANHSPERRPHSVRRTTTLDVTWPGERDGCRHLFGVARDIYSGTSLQVPTVISLDGISATISSDRYIETIDSTPPQVWLSSLVGTRVSGQLRAQLVQLAEKRLIDNSALYLLIDDFVGANVVADWAWSRWLAHTPVLRQRRKKLLDSMEGVCIGFMPGASSLNSSGDYQERNASPVQGLNDPGDPEAWHPLAEIEGVSMRRARRMDVWVDGDIHVDAGFQDSATNPDGSRTAVHEYTLRVVIDRHSLCLKRVVATPHILPFPECPGAVNNLHLLIGLPVGDLRIAVRERLQKTLGCTHLNDAMRALADVPTLVHALRCLTDGVEIPRSV